jgi:hypothetical protein
MQFVLINQEQNWGTHVAQWSGLQNCLWQTEFIKIIFAGIRSLL